jgi:amidase
VNAGVLGAATIARRVRACGFTATAAVEAALRRIREANGAINAVVTVDEAGAQRAARAIDEGGAAGLLAGVPFTLKDTFETAGVRTTFGFPLFAEHVPEADAAVARALRDAGAVLVGKTNLPPFAYGPITENPVFGRTNHPRDAARSPGGSSGGSAAAVAAGLSAFDIGTDATGSLRIPASFCGVVALRPTYGRVPLTGARPAMFPAVDRWLTVAGPIARSVEDVDLVMRVLAGAPPTGDAEARGAPWRSVDALPMDALRFAVAPALWGLPVARVIRDALGALGRRLDADGAVVTATDAPAPFEAHESVLLDFLRLGRQLVGGLLGGDSDAAPFDVPGFAALLERRDRLVAAWDARLEEVDAFLMPATPCAAPVHGDAEAPLLIDGEAHPFWMIDRHTFAASLTGHPAIVLPLGEDPDGMPFGVQLVGRRGRDEELVAIARLVEDVLRAAKIT